jgi:uncharacterized protein YebE (UPF0316 family)
MQEFINFLVKLLQKLLITKNRYLIQFRTRFQKLSIYQNIKLLKTKAFFLSSDPPKQIIQSFHERTTHTPQAMFQIYSR